ncbi:MAG: hypothetical protein V1728_01625 [Candidatus Micrarchaeota archaeon]
MVEFEKHWKFFLAAAVLCFLAALIVLAFLASTAYQLRSTQANLSLSQAQNENLSRNVAALSSQKSDLQYSLTSLNSTLISTQEALSAKEAQAQHLQSDLDEAQSNLSSAQSSIQIQQQSIQQLLSEISDTRSTLNSTWQWLKDNDYLPVNFSWNSDIFKQRISEDCIDQGKLNAGCISYRMQSTALSLRYRNDIDAGKTDHLQSLTETIQREGGDCEDYSLFVKAALNSIKAEKKNLDIVAWTRGEGEFVIYPRASAHPTSYFYYPNATGVDMGSLDHLHPYVICYSVGSSGHCTIALSDNEIKTSSQVNMLANARVFEPQNGQYLGMVGKEFSVCEPSVGDCQERINNIFLMISDDDIYQAYSGQWTGQVDYIQKLSKVQNEFQTSASIR